MRNYDFLITSEFKVHTFHPVDRGRIVLRNVGIVPEHCTASSPENIDVKYLDYILS